MNRRSLQIAALAALTLGTIGLRVSGSSPARTVQAETVAERVVQPMILSSGQLAYVREVPLSSEVIGRVAQVLVREGEPVQQGQLLLTLDASALRAEVEQNQARLSASDIQIEQMQLKVETLTREFGRTEELARSQFVGPAALDEARHKLRSAQVDLRASHENRRQALAQLSIAQQHLGKTEVRSPLTGTVVAVPIRVGETAIPSTGGIPGSQLMSIADTSSMVAEVQVDESEISSVSVGQRARVHPAAKSSAGLEGRVLSVGLAPKAGAQQRSYLVRVQLAGNADALRTGMTCRVELFSSGLAPTLAIPLQAVLTDGSSGPDASASREAGRGAADGAGQVWVVNGGRVERREVRLGLSDDTYQQVLSGLKPQDRVVTGPSRLLRELVNGDSVREEGRKDGKDDKDDKDDRKDRTTGEARS